MKDINYRCNEDKVNNNYINWVVCIYLQYPKQNRHDLEYTDQTQT